MIKWLWSRFFYRRFMKLAHRFNWHYAPPIYPDGDTLLWCKWCGFRDVVKRRARPGDPEPLKTAAQTAAQQEGMK